MITKLLTLFVIIFFLTLVLGILKSRRPLWATQNSIHSRLFTIRALIVIGLIVLFLFFSLFR
ncbi:MAG: hypothetical protein ACLGH8_06900 [Bacteroidia bacterium]